jgi:hypothetical protein
MPQTELPQAAIELLANRVHDPIFFEKLAAEYNIHPSSDAERAQLLELAAELRAHHDGASKQASAGGANPFLADALASLQAVVRSEPANIAKAVKSAAVNLVASDNELAAAAQAYGQFLASR